MGSHCPSQFAALGEIIPVILRAPDPLIPFSIARLLTSKHGHSPQSCLGTHDSGSSHSCCWKQGLPTRLVSHLPRSW